MITAPATVAIDTFIGPSMSPTLAKARSVKAPVSLEQPRGLPGEARGRSRAVPASALVEQRHCIGNWLTPFGRLNVQIPGVWRSTSLEPYMSATVLAQIGDFLSAESDVSPLRR